MFDKISNKKICKTKENHLVSHSQPSRFIYPFLTWTLEVVCYIDSSKSWAIKWVFAHTYKAQIQKVCLFLKVQSIVLSGKYARIEAVYCIAWFGFYKPVQADSRTPQYNFIIPPFSSTLFCLSLCPFVCLSVTPSIHPSMYPPTHMWLHIYKSYMN